MACCILTAYFMNRIIKACELLDLHILEIRYNDFDDAEQPLHEETNKAARWAVAKLAVQGMTCAGCVDNLTKVITALGGIDRVSVSLPLAKATVVYDSALTRPSDIVRAVEQAGYGAAVGDRTAAQQLENLNMTTELVAKRDAFQKTTVLSSIVVVANQMSKVKQQPDVLVEVLHWASLLLGCWVMVIATISLHKSAMSKLMRGRLTMDTLLSFSLSLSLALSVFNIALYGQFHARTYFDSGSFLAAVILGGRYLDALLERRANAGFASLYRLQADASLIKTRKHDAKIAAVLLRPGDEIGIEANSIVPCDCYVIEGFSLVDESTMTGESTLARKSPGDFLMSGTRNVASELVAIVHKEQQDSSLQQLLDSVADATEQKTSARGAVDTMLSYFVSTILALALLGFVWTFVKSDASILLSERINAGCERAMAILAIACPCALGLATPSAVMAGLDAARARGIIVTGGLEALQTLSTLTHVVMDKTGTLTVGRLSVSLISLAKSSAEVEALDDTAYMLLCAAEGKHAQIHPVGHAVFKWCLSQLDESSRRIQNDADTRILSPSNSANSSHGIATEVKLPASRSWTAVHIGTLEYLGHHGICIQSTSTATTKLPGQTQDNENRSTNTNTNTVHFAIAHTYRGSLALQDTIRASAPSVVSSLRALGLCLTMLTGDSAAEAARVSFALGIPVLSSTTLPHEKAHYIDSLRKPDPNRGGTSMRTGTTIAMLGDGINDTPALATADVGIVLSSSRSFAIHNPTAGAAASVAGVIIMSPDLNRLVDLIRIARQTMTHARWNTLWVVAYNVVGVALAMGVCEPWGLRVDAARASVLMALSSSGVLASGLWLRKSLLSV